MKISRSHEDSFLEIRDFLETGNEFLLRYKYGKSFALLASEIEIELTRGRPLLGFLDDRGFQFWSVRASEVKDKKLFLTLERNFGRECETAVLTPRVPAAELGASVKLARIEKAGRIAAAIKKHDPRAKVRAVRLSGENGRTAQIFLETAAKKHFAALADLSGTLSPERLVSTSILRLAEFSKRKKNRPEKLWLISEEKQARRVRNLQALLRESWKSGIENFEISYRENDERLKPLAPLAFEHLWRGRAGNIPPLEDFELSLAARRIIELAPEKIDAVFSRRGETLRFHGLPFARVRRLAGEEKIWFGIERDKSLLTARSEKRFFDLVEDLELYRRADSSNKRHVFYRAAPEAWLESVLRRCIRRLDANLILSPVFQQFRAGRERVDLLALRRDGRLVIIEIKCAPDREMVFQAADYWRKIELQRRRGIFKKARLFGEREISDRPAVCYLVAPTLAFHPDFEFLAGALSEKIEMHRFFLAENWRENLKVLERREVK
jgi:hypothetical protein